MIETITSVISTLALNMSSTAFLEFLQKCFESDYKQDQQLFADKLEAYLKKHGNSCEVSSVIKLLEAKGLLSTSKSSVFLYSLKVGFGGAGYYGDSLDEKQMRAAYDKLEFEQIGYHPSFFICSFFMNVI